MSRGVIVSALIVCGTAVALTFVTLQGHTRQSQQRSYDAVQVIDGVRVLDGLEWRAIAGEDVEMIAADVEEASANLLAEVAGASTSTRHRLLGSAEEYTDAVAALVAALRDGDLELAREVDEGRVDPGFEALIASADAIDVDQRAAAARTDSVVRVLTWASAMVAVGVVGGLLWFAFASRERKHDRQRQAELDRQFRSLVESSPDVIVIVDRTGSMTVMSPSLRSLAEFSAGSVPNTVEQLLPPSAYSAWADADHRMSSDGAACKVELTLDRRDGTALWIEATGSVLADRAGEHVWIWRDITQRKQLELQLTHQAFHDPLTGAANRALLHDRVEHALRLAARSARQVSLLFCDLDDFKTVNDSLGHGRGDELLNIVTQRILDCVRDGDTVARLGGDEFAVLLEDADTEHARALAERIISVISYEVTLDERTIFPSISIGIATAVTGGTTDELLRNADLAMYSAKRAGKGRAELFHDDMHQTTSDLLELQTELRNAITTGELTLSYQPTLDLETGRVDGVEALLRWNHPTLGSISPARFIPVAEATGMIIAIGRDVLNEACHAAMELQQGRQRPIRMHVNLSPKQLRDPTIARTVQQALERSGLKPELLVLEVTEGFLLDDHSAIARLHELHDLGVLIAIDDFGTGYTSLNYLQQLPIDILKIDQSFVSGQALHSTQRTAFLHAIVELAKGLNLRSVAEGVEDLDQLDELRALGCDAGQGFLWAPATPLTTVREAIAEIDEYSGGGTVAQLRRCS